MKNFFNKMNAILVGGLLGGMLVAGLGSGIALAEYMEFEYDNSLVAEKATSTEDFPYHMSSNEVVVVSDASNLSFDEEVPAGTVITRVEYNPQTVEVVQNVYSSGLDSATIIETHPRYIADDFETFMENKDIILEGLKAGKIMSFESDHHFAKSVICNPADKERVFRSVEDAANAMGSAVKADTKIVG